MGKYLEKPFPTVKNVVDGHIHMHKWHDENGEPFLHGLEEYRKVCGLTYITLASLPSGNPIPVPRDVSNNIICAFYKLLNENTFAYGGFIYPSYPVRGEDLAGMELVTQLDELMEIGFDGIKMLEGKPNLYKRVGNPLDSELFDSVFAKMEKENTPLLMHALDPEDFWTNATEDRVARGWFYGDGSYPAYEEIQSQVKNVLEKYPSLNLCLAHFFFSSENPEALEEMFAKYKNLSVDITPGGEMYIGFEKRPEYYRAFFEKYADRVCFGTDMDYPVHMEAGIWLCDREYRYFAGNEFVPSFDDHNLHGINLPTECVQKIFSDNVLNRFGGKPKGINKQALKKYIEKYKHLIIDRDLARYIDELSEKYL